MTPRVVVVGSVNLDHLVEVERLPAPGETVPATPLRRMLGGKGANAALAAARLGADVRFVGAVGRDTDGDEAVAYLGSMGVGVETVGRDALPTGAALVITDAQGENVITVSAGANASLTAERTAADVAAHARPGDAVLANFEVPLSAVLAAARMARVIGCTFVLDPAPAFPVPRELAALCSLLTPNTVELGQLGCTGPHDLLDAGAAAVAVTLGVGGVELHQPGVAVSSVPAFPVEVIDTVGAGDAFAAGAATGLAAGGSALDAVRLGAAAGALATQGRGATGASYNRNDVDRLLAEAGSVA